MNGLRVALLAASLVVATGGGTAHGRQHAAADGYAFERKEYVLGNLEVTIVEHANYRELLAAMPGGGPPRAVRKVQAWSLITPDGRCEIHIVDQLENYTPEAIGHELAHCIYGRWHS